MPCPSYYFNPAGHGLRFLADGVISLAAVNALCWGVCHQAAAEVFDALEKEGHLDGDVLRGPGGLSVSSMQMKKVLLADDLWRGAQESWYYEHCCMSLVLVSHSPPPTPKAGHAHGEGNR